MIRNESSRLFLLLTAMWLFTGHVFATHNRAGEITYEQIADLTLRITITTYTKASSTAADRDSLDIFFGDGNSRRIGRNNGPNNQGENIGNDIKKNIYTTNYTYSGPGRYVISMTDPNRNGGILNVNPPSSENVQFHLETTVIFLNPLFEGFNSSPVLLNPPIEIGCVGQPFTHNPNAFDPDFDSLTFELIVPLQDRNTPVPNYSFPNEISPGANNTIELNPATGDFLWRSPQRPGEYNITILIREFRNGREIGSVIRDLQILILECDNRPPRIEAPDEICVVAGTRLVIPVIATDPDFGQRIRMEASGGPFQVSFQPAQLQVASGYQPSPLSGQIIWQTDCSHISDGFYNVLVKAEDNFFNSAGLSVLKTIRIKVVGPAPESMTAEIQADEVVLSWQKPYDCESPVNEIFRGFAVYRRNSSLALMQDTCNPGLEGKGYALIAQNVLQSDGGKYVYKDATAEKGRIYCYRVVAVFARLTQAGFPVNRTESLFSKEVCIQLNRDIPFITKASVTKTATGDGEVEVHWTRPYLPDFDTITYPGPYTFQLLYSAGINTNNFIPVPGATFTFTGYSDISDTSFVHTFINTASQGYTYQVLFDVRGGVRYGSSLPASTVFSSIISSDRRNILTWISNTPWENQFYDVLRLNENSGVFERVGTTSTTSFTDRGLENGKEYCYKIESFGTYGLPGIIDPIQNFSQELCGVPVDTVPPCIPDLTVGNDCALADPLSGPESLFNTLRWTDVGKKCEDSDDVDLYRIYYKRFRDEPFRLLTEVSHDQDTQWIDRPEDGLAGCYAVSSVDVTGNESALSAEVCVENCPVFVLPNTFTPNGDGKNDLFIPRANRYVSYVEFNVFNVWGNKVFETSDPTIQWAGNDMNGKALAEGTYYYTCRVFESRLDGVVLQSQFLSGYIELIR
jgi:gliding motility-associated-like protein